jgi:transcriptional regulator with XRE-family HTH domain
MAQKTDKFLFEIGKHVRKLRLEKGLSVYELADAANVGKSQLYRIEAGETNFTLCILYKLAEVLEVQPKDLIDV